MIALSFQQIKDREAEKLTHKRLKDFGYDYEKILKLIDDLNPNKAHSHNEISTRMWKLGNLAVIKSLSFIFQNCLNPFNT